MQLITNKASWLIFGILCTGIGLYPFMYFFVDQQFGLLSTKSSEILTNALWNIGFYGHIVFGGFALLSGWTQFSKRMRRKRLGLHRNLGKFYVISVFISGITAIYIGFFATGGIISTSGFVLARHYLDSNNLSGFPGNTPKGYPQAPVLDDLQLCGMFCSGNTQTMVTNINGNFRILCSGLSLSCLAVLGTQFRCSILDGQKIGPDARRSCDLNQEKGETKRKALLICVHLCYSVPV